MSLHRRRFLQAAGGALGASALAPLLAADHQLSAALERVSRAGSGPSANAAEGEAFATVLRDEYLLGPDIIYLNHASIGTVPRAVHEAHKAYLSVCETNPWLYMWGGAWDEAREDVRSAAARTLGCTTSEVAITHNTTEGFNTLAAGLPLGPGDEVLFSTLNHPGASIPWRHHGSARGYSVRSFDFPMSRVPVLSAGEIVALHVEQVRPETRVLALPHIDNVLGLRHPIGEIAEAAHAAGVEFVAVDGAQSVGMVPLDLSSTPVDFYAASPHKWVQAPKGLGLLYVRGGSADLRALWVTWGQERWRGTVRIYEDYGTRNMPALLALGDALEFQAAIDPASRAARYAALRGALEREVEAVPRLGWNSPRDPELGAPLVSVSVDGMPAGRFGTRMYRERGIVFRAFETDELNSVRISPNLATSLDDISEFGAATSDYLD